MRRDKVVPVLACAVSMFVLVFPLGAGPTVVAAKDPGGIYGSGSWKNQTYYKFQTDVIGGDATLLVDSHGGIHIFFVEPMNNSLVYATNLTGSDWSLSTIDSNVFSVWPRGIIAFFSLGEIPVVVYGDNASTMKYAQKISSNWVVHSISGAIGGPIAARQSLSGGFSILYAKNQTLFLAEGHDDQWDFTTVLDLPGPSGVSADFGLNHSVHVASSNFSSRQLFYSTNQSGNWTTEVIDGNCAVRWSWSLKLLVDPDGDVRVAYCDEFNNNIKYGASDRGIWTIRAVYGSSAYNAPSDVDMALGAEGHAMLSFRGSHGYYYIPASLGIWTTELLIGTGSEEGGTGATGPTTIAAHGSRAYILYIAYSESDDSLCFKIASNAADFEGQGPEDTDASSTTLVGVAVALALVVVVVMVLVLRFRKKA